MSDESLSTATLPQHEAPTGTRRVPVRGIPSSLSSLGGIPEELLETKEESRLEALEPEVGKPTERIYVQITDVGTPMMRVISSRKTEPELIINDSARPMLTDRVEKTLNHLYPVLERAARRNYTHVSKVEVSGFTDPEEGDQEVVVTQWVQLSPGAALDYWDKLGAAVQVWMEYLPDELKNVATDRVAVEVRWNIDEPEI